MSIIKSPNLLEVSIDNKYKGRDAEILYFLGQRFNFPAADVLHDLCEFTIPRPLGSPDNYRIYLPDENLADSTYDVEVVSTSANDQHTTGTGVRQVKIDYLDANWDAQSTTIDMTGTTAATAGITARRINDFHSNLTGELSVAAGDITLRTATGSTVQSPWNTQQNLGFIATGGNKDMTALFTVPNGKKLYTDAQLVSSANSDQSIRLRSNIDPMTRAMLPDPSIFLFQSVALVGSNQNARKELEWMEFPAKADLKVSCSPTATGADSSVHLTFLLVDDT